MKPLALIVLLAASLGAADSFLDWMDRTAQQQLARREAEVARIRTPAEAAARQAAVRARILELIGGLPDYSGPLNARVTGRIERPRYSIEKVIFESLPKLFVTANVYRPREAGRYPGVLLPLGHWNEGKPAVQQIAANLAMKGFVVVAYDPLGQGERQQAYDRRMRGSLAGGSVNQHLLSGAASALAGESFARYRIWDAKRALDYLVSRPDVEADKIGCTGCSGGGTVTTCISALDPRIKVAAPACYSNTWQLLFSGPTGDSEQSLPGFLAAGLDMTDYVELFAPKPYLIVSTVEDFFPLEGARRVFEEARRWYGVFDATDRVQWAVGPGKHGTPREVRERIYEWMIRWLKDGRGDAVDEPVEMLPNHELFATAGGQVDGREIHEVIYDGFRARQLSGTAEQMLARLRELAPVSGQRPPAVRVVSDTPGPDFRTQQIAFETEPGLEIQGTLTLPGVGGRKPAVLLVNGSAAQAGQFAKAGQVVMSLTPRGSPPGVHAGYAMAGDWITNTRAWLIGRNLAAMRAADIVRGVDLLAARSDVNAAWITAAARDVAGVWLLAAAALDPRISRIWLDRTPYSLRAAIREPLHHNLHDAVIPGFAQRWDLEDLRKALGTRPVIWSDPSDWMGAVAPGIDGCLYRTFEEPDDRFIERLIR
ncbi:MAG: acetylxylan esterase [Acidobacteria bacterium]|nr:acetylxylan esterase [Acidobacteriota bacterium]